jgi:hypothetical protein
MNLVLNIPFVGRALSREVAPEVEAIERAPLPVAAIAAVIAVAAVWVGVGALVLSTLGELGPLLTSMRVLP